MKKLLFTLFLLFFATNCWAADYWVYIRTYDRSGVTTSDDAGRSKRGDIIAILPDTPQFIPTEKEKKAYAIIKVSNITKTDRENYLQGWQEQIDTNPDGSPIFKNKAYRRRKLNTSTLGITKTGIVATLISATNLKNNISEKTELDIAKYEHKRKIYNYVQIPAFKLVRLLFPYVYAQTISTINKTGEDYNTLTLWEDAVDGVLTALQQADCYNDDGDLADNPTIDGSTTTSSYYMKITVPVGERHNGTAGTGFCINYTTALANWEQVIALLDGYSVVEWIEIKGWTKSSSYAFAIELLAPYCTVSNNLVHDGQETGIRGDNSDGTYSRIYNNIVYDCAGYGLWIGSPAYASFYNNTVVGCGTGIWFPNGGTNAYVKNNLVNDCTTDYNVLTPHATSTSNITNDTPVAAHCWGVQADTGTTDGASASKLIDSDQNFLTTVKVGMIIKNTTDTTYTYVTAVDSNGQLSVANDIFANTEAYIIYSNYYGNAIFVNEGEGTEDLHLDSTDTVAIDKGTDLGNGAWDTDIDGRDRDTEGDTWDIGADEYVAAGGAARRIIMIQ